MPYTVTRSFSGRQEEQGYDLRDGQPLQVQRSEQLPAQLRSDKRKQHPQRRKTAGSLDISEPERLFANHLQRRDHHASTFVWDVELFLS